MSFEVAAEAYGRFMGRYSEPLADRLLERAGVRAGERAGAEVEPDRRALDVGCGPGAVTARLSDLLGADRVAAVDPSEPFVAAVRERCPGVDVRLGTAEDLPHEADRFDVVLAQLVVHFMTDPVRGLAEMRRVARPGGVLAASVWDYAGERAPLSVFWRAARALDPGTVDESALPGAREGHLAALAARAGWREVEATDATVSVGYRSLEEWWEPYTLGVGPAGDLVARLDADDRAALRARCAELLPEPPFTVTAAAWTVLGRA
jgi:SAM-dependent methyltransferase